MSCSNSVYLVCCYDPTNSFLACNPTIDGTPNSSFVPGNTYVGQDAINGNICYSASSTPVGTVYNLQQTSYTSTIDCDDCQLSYGGGCPIIPPTFADAILVNCCDPTDTFEARVPSTYSPGALAIAYDSKCWTLQSFGGSGGVELQAGYDGCAACTTLIPCCECVEMDIDPALFVFTDDGNYFVEYTECSGSTDTYTATSLNSNFTICSQSGESITTYFYFGSTLYSGNTYPYQPLGLGYFVSATTLSVCTEEPCGISPSPTPTPTSTPTPTPLPSSSPSVSPTPTPTISSSAAIVPPPFTYSVAITGTCVGVGSALISASGGTAPYTFDWINPVLGTGDFKTGLSAGTYIVRANDSSMPVNNEIFINVTISSGISLVVSTVTDTTCGDDNGSVTVVATSDNSDITYYLYSGATLISQQSTTNLTAQFVPLPAGNYNIVGVNASGCSGSTGNFVINESDPFDFGFYVVNDTPCQSPTGKIYVTGQTGNAPYTYLWSNLQTTSSITGLTQGSYSVTVTDSQGCSLNKSVLVELVPSIGLGSWSATTPSCFASDGSLTLTITGGTGPYLYSGSNGTTFVTYSQNYTFSGLPAGSFFVSVTDAALCKTEFSTTLQTPQSFYSVQEIVTNSTCSTSNGEVNVFLQGGSPPYIYSLSSSTFSVSALTNSTQYIFNNLSNGEYVLTITDGGPCPYISNITIESENLFDVEYSATTSSCGQPNGTLTIMTTTGGTLPYIYSLDNGQSITTSSLEVTFSSLVGGTYVYSITDASGCVITGSAVVPEESVLDFSLYPTSCGVSGSGGTITALITSGQPPFVYNWSSNVTGNPQQVYVSGLTGGTYSLTITDDNGCVKTRSVLIECSPIITSYQIFNMCDSDFTFTSGTKRGMVQMLNEGFNDLVFPSTDCILSAATFTIEVEVSGNTYSDMFYTGSTLLDVPTDVVYFQAVEDLLLSIDGVTGVVIDPITSQVTIESEDSLGGQGITINLIIGYTILCPTPCP
jgi:SprB repeat